MIKGKTATGFTFKIDQKAIQDMEFIELVAAARDDGLLLPEILKKLLGEEQKKALYDHIREEHGSVPVDAVTNEIMDIIATFNETPETKN